MSELDRLLDAAREAEPDPLGDAATDALVQNARRTTVTLAERVLDEARSAEPAPLTERELRSMAQRAAMTGRARHRRWTRRRVMATSALAATIAAAAVTLVVLERDTIDPAPSEPAALAVAPERTDLDLPTGDRIVAASGARFHVELPEPRIRRVRLGSGSMLFDVRAIEEGRFSVSTPNAQIVVLGTVFSVRAAERATTVWVYEGAVRVQTRDGTRVIEAGGVLHVGTTEAGADALASAGREAAARRAPRSAAPIASAAESTAVAAGSPPPIEALARPRAARSIRETRQESAPIEPSADSPGTAGTTPTEVRALIASGDATRALAVTREAIARGDTDPWRMLEGDALRVLGRLEDAASAYERAARELPAPRRQQAGFLEARLRIGLSDVPGALRALRAAEVTAPGSVLRERGLALEVQLLARLGRRADAARGAADYLRDYPDGPDAEAMRASTTASSSPSASEREPASESGTDPP